MNRNYTTRFGPELYGLIYITRLFSRFSERGGIRLICMSNEFVLRINMCFHIKKCFNFFFPFYEELYAKVIIDTCNIMF